MNSFIISPPLPFRLSSSPNFIFPKFYKIEEDYKSTTVTLSELVPVPYPKEFVTEYDYSIKMASVWVVWLALVVVQLGFGAYGVIVSKFAKENKADPLVFSLIRDAGCFPVLLMAAFVSEKKIQIPSIR